MCARPDRIQPGLFGVSETVSGFHLVSAASPFRYSSQFENNYWKCAAVPSHRNVQPTGSDPLYLRDDEVDRPRAMEV